MSSVSQDATGATSRTAAGAAWPPNCDIVPHGVGVGRYIDPAFAASKLEKYMTPPALQARFRFWPQDRTAGKYIRPLMRPSTRAPNDIRSQKLVTLTASKPPVSLSGSFCDRSDLFPSAHTL